MRRNHWNKFFLLLFSLMLAACQTATESPTPTPTADEIIPTGQQTVTISTPTPTPTPTSTPTPTHQPIPTVDEAELKGLQLTVIHPWINEAEITFQELVDDFNRNNSYGITVTPVSAGGLRAVGDRLDNEGMSTNLAIGYGFDLGLSSETGNLLDLAAYMFDKDYGITTAYAKDSILYVLSPMIKQQEHWWFLPIAYQPGVMFYNESWAKELGFTKAPLTPDEFKAQMLPAAQAMLLDNDIDNNGAGGMWISDAPLAAFSWYGAFNGQFSLRGSGLSFDRLAANQSFTFLKQLYNEDASWTGLQEVPYDYFARRVALAYEGTLDDVLNQEGAMKRADSQDEWTTLPYPTPDGKGSLSVETLSIGLAKGTPAEQLGSWLFARWLLNRNSQEVLVNISGYWPVIDDPQTIAPSYVLAHPAWASALRKGVRLTVAPEEENWAYGRLILQDAVRRVYALDEEYIPNVLDMLESTLQEFTGKNKGE